MKTQNNSNEMKTQVQMYIVEETQSLIYDNVELVKWNDLVKQLGLKGQEVIVQPNKSPIPYLCLNSIQKNILETLCPSHVDVKEYDLMPIPIQILDAIALSIKEGYFNRIQIWYNEKQKDPACIGITGYWYGDDVNGSLIKNKSGNTMQFKSLEELQEYQNSIGAKGKWTTFSDKSYYILGRWSDVKESFQQLAIRAKEIFMLTKRNDIQTNILKYQRELEDLERESFDKFGI